MPLLDQLEHSKSPYSILRLNTNDLANYSVVLTMEVLTLDMESVIATVPTVSPSLSTRPSAGHNGALALLKAMDGG